VRGCGVRVDVISSTTLKPLFLDSKKEKFAQIYVITSAGFHASTALRKEKINQKIVLLRKINI
jgi:hypothetical protein